MEKFTDTDIADGDEAKSVIHHYEWSIADGENETSIIGKWALVNATTETDEKVNEALLKILHSNMNCKGGKLIQIK